MRKLLRLVLALAATAIMAGLQSRANTITNQLVVHLSFDDTLNDDSGRGNSAVYNSSNGLSIHPPAPTFVPGKLGKGFQFTTRPDGSLIEYASLGYPPDLKFGTDTDFSIAFWFLTAHSNIVGGGDPALIANRNWNSSSSRGWGVFFQGDNTTVRVHYTVTDPSVTKLSVRPSTPGGENLYDGAWHHLAVTCRRGSNIITYVDGVKENTSAFAAGADTFDTDDQTTDLGVPYAVNIGQDGTGAYTQGSTDNPPPVVAGTAGVTNAVVDDLGIWRRALTDLEVISIFNFAQQGSNLVQVPDSAAPVVLSFTPLNGASGVAPNVPTAAVILNQGAAVATNTLKLLIDDREVAFTVKRDGPTNTLTYVQPHLFAPSSLHTNQLIFADTSGAAPATNTSVYTVGAWTNLYLPPPLYFEDFDSLPLATNPPSVYPAGWTASNCTDPGGVDGWDLFNPRSDAYYDWQIVPADAVVQNFNYGARLLNVNGPMVLNGAPLTTLVSGNIAFGASDQRDGNQIDILFTRDYDLTGKSNVWVAFNSAYSQESDQIGALEYSIDQGNTWLPVIYMLSDGPGEDDIVRTASGAIDALTTFSTNHIDVALCLASGIGNFYGAFIGVASNQWANLAPYISGRTPDDHTTYHKVEKFRLPAADGQPRVRFRFVLAASDSWAWGIDSFGLYSIPDPPPLNIQSVGFSDGKITVRWNGTPDNLSGLQKTASLVNPNWMDIPDTIGQTSYTEATAGAGAFYRAARF